MSKVINTKIKYSIVFGLISLTILAFGIIAFMPNEASAGENATYSPYNEPNLNDDNNEDTTNPKPVVSSISPSSGNLGSGSKNVTITGSGFTPDSVARWNGSDRPTTFIDYAHVVIHLNSSDMVGSAGRYITVWNPAPGGGYSNAAFFTINGYVAPSTGTTVKSKAVQGSNSSGAVNNSGNNSGSVQGAGDTSATDESFNSLASNAIFGSNGFMPSGLIQWLLLAIFILIIVIVTRKIFFEDKYHSEPLKHA